MNKTLEYYYEVPIKLEYGQLSPIMDWCKKNCLGDWKLMEVDDGYNFYFEDKRDCIIFSIWKL